MAPCFYCLDEKVSICVCVACQTRLEHAELDLKRLKELQAFRRATWSKKMATVARQQRRKK